MRFPLAWPNSLTRWRFMTDRFSAAASSPTFDNLPVFFFFFSSI
jgi:hypothetical protein